MSGQWEVVGRKKDRSSKLPVPTNNEQAKKKPAFPAKITATIEDIFSKEQVKNLYAIAKPKGKQDGAKPQEKSSPKLPATPKKAAPAVKKVDKSQEVKAPKSIDSALSNINADEFKGIFEKNKITFPDQPTFWLKEMVQYLNKKMPVEIQDPVFLNKPEGFPWIMIPSAIKSTIEASLKQAGPENVQLFFNISLNTMIEELSKQQSAIGSKIYLQSIMLNDPKLALLNIDNYNNKLKNSYQNQTPIGQSICWVFAQAGIKDFNVGFQVYEKMYSNLLQLKNYSRFVTKYLVDLAKKHSKSQISQEQYFAMVDLIYSPKKNFPTDLTKDLNNILPRLTAMLLDNNKASKSELVEPLLKRVQSSNKQCSEYTCETLITYFSKDTDSYKVWNKLYSSNISSSAVVLNHLVGNWKRYNSVISNKKFGELLRSFSKVNEELMAKKKKEDGLASSAKAIKTLSQKMVTKKSSSCSCRYFPLILFLAASGWIYYDVSKNGSWDSSCTSKALNRTGVYAYTNKALDHANQGTKWVQDRIEEQFPGFSESARELSEPYIELCGNLRKITCNTFGNMKEYVVTKVPIVLQTIDHYAPGLIDSICKYSHAVWTTFVDLNIKVFVYLRDEVFVGTLSPENLKKVALDVATQAYAKTSEGFNWVYEKIETAVK